MPMRPTQGMGNSALRSAFMQWLKDNNFELPDPGNRRFNKQKERKRLGAVKDRMLQERMAQKNRLYGGGLQP